MEKFADTIEKIGQAVIRGYQKIENGVVNGYRSVERGVVRGFETVTDDCVEVLFAKEGETGKEAKRRLARDR